MTAWTAGIRNHGYTSFRSTKGSQTGPNGGTDWRELVLRELRGATNGTGGNMDKKKLKWYAIPAAAAIAATLLFPIAIREGSGWIAGKILENAGLETETGETPKWKACPEKD